MNARIFALLGLALAPLVFFDGCSSTGRDGGNEHEIQKVFINKMRVRRPLGEGADPKAGPGGLDYRSDPLPNERLDCETLTTMFEGVDLRGLRACFAKLTAETPAVSYRLRREHRPYLELENPDDAPACLRLELLRIPVPREIVFQSPEKGHYTCYSARVDLEANQLWGGLKVPTDRLSILMRFPLTKHPSNDEETVRVLAAWALTPIWKEGSGKKGRQLSAKIVPDRLCRRCLGEKDFLSEGDPDHLLWP